MPCAPRGSAARNEGRSREDHRGHLTTGAAVVSSVSPHEVAGHGPDWIRLHLNAVLPGAARRTTSAFCLTAVIRARQFFNSSARVLRGMNQHRSTLRVTATSGETANALVRRQQFAAGR